MKLVEVEPDAWDPLLEGLSCPDAFYRRAYVEASCRLDNSRPVFLHAPEADVVFPLTIRDVPGAERLCDAKTQYGYGGPVARDRATLDVEAFWAAYERWCTESRVVSTFVRFHPLLENQRLAARSAHCEQLGPTFSWLLGGEGNLLESLHGNPRRTARKAAEDVSVSVEAEPESLDEFAALYAATMRGHGADSFYFFPDEFWTALAKTVRPYLARFDGVVGGDVVASVLCLGAPPWLHYYLGGALPAGRSLGATSLLLVEAARWGRAHGFEQLHLGGGVGGRMDSLWRFKRRFAPEGAREAWIAKLVHDREAYIDLTGGDEIHLSGFFPAYRRVPTANVAPTAR